MVISCLLQFIFQEEESLEGIFPEFQDLPSSVTYMETRLIGMHRLTALGCQTGHVQCTLVDLTSNGKSKGGVVTEVLSLVLY